MGLANKRGLEAPGPLTPCPLALPVGVRPLPWGLSGMTAAPCAGQTRIRACASRGSFLFSGFFFCLNSTSPNASLTGGKSTLQGMFNLLAEQTAGEAAALPADCRVDAPCSVLPGLPLPPPVQGSIAWSARKPVCILTAGGRALSVQRWVIGDPITVQKTCRENGVQREPRGPRGRGKLLGGRQSRVRATHRPSRCAGPWGSQTGRPLCPDPGP